MLDEKESVWLLDELNWKTEGNKVKTHIQFTEICVCVCARLCVCVRLNSAHLKTELRFLSIVCMLHVTSLQLPRPCEQDLLHLEGIHVPLIKPAYVSIATYSFVVFE